jgi:poly(A) polymerase
MVEPTVVARSEHSISRRDIDPDALKVLYRLHEHGHSAYLVGGSVRDLLLGRRPKDFDVGTSAHPHQVKKLFRNCWIIGRRFRLAHVKFGPKTIEVATFRRQVDPSELPADPAESDRAVEASPELAVTADAPFEAQVQAEGTHLAHVRAHDRLIHRDNTFGTAEEDAFRRDFTINALFYDIATFSIIDYVGGLRDLEQRLIRSIGEPGVRFLEDPVRMLRAVVFAARLDFRIDEPILEAMDVHGHELARAAPARLMEEYFKILRSGFAENSLQMLKDTQLLRAITPELDDAGAALWESVARLDAYRRQFAAPPDAMTNAILVGTLLAPLGLVGTRRFSADALERKIELGVVPIPRRDVERLHQVLALQTRLLDLRAPYRAQRAVLHRHVLQEALTWLEIHGGRPDVVQHWRSLQAEPGPGHAPEVDGQREATAERPFRRRRRRRRRRSPPAGQT